MAENLALLKALCHKHDLADQNQVRHAHADWSGERLVENSKHVLSVFLSDSTS